MPQFFSQSYAGVRIFSGAYFGPPLKPQRLASFEARVPLHSKVIQRLLFLRCLANVSSSHDCQTQGQEGIFLQVRLPGTLGVFPSSAA